MTSFFDTLFTFLVQLNMMDSLKMVVFGRNKKELHRMQQSIALFLRERFNLEIVHMWLDPLQIHFIGVRMCEIAHI